MSEDNIAALVLLISFIIGALTYRPKNVTQNNVVIQPKTVDNLIFNEAKDILVTMGFSASESKKMLNEVGLCNSSDEFVRKALQNIKLG
jgi:Holliday junction resolvasome RuvABC DNA-binding subunit